MFMSIQRKKGSINRLNTTEMLDQSMNDSFLDSSTIKRFNRSKNAAE